MSTAYYRVKKYRHLKRSTAEIILSSNASDPKQCRFDDSNSYASHDEDSSFDLTNRAPDFSSSNSQSSPSSQQSCSSEESSRESDNDDSMTVTIVSFTEKLHSWCVRFRNILTVEAIEALLVILRAENIPNLPKSVATLLQIKSNPNVKSITRTQKNTNGFYVYFGIQEGLKAIITDEKNTRRALLAYYLILMASHYITVQANNFGLTQSLFYTINTSVNHLLLPHIAEIRSHEV